MKPILLIIVIVGGISTLVYLIAREFINYLTKFQYRLLKLFN